MSSLFTFVSSKGRWFGPLCGCGYGRELDRTDRIRSGGGLEVQEYKRVPEATSVTVEKRRRSWREKGMTGGVVVPLYRF